jgi:cell division septation protein DedD
MEHFDGINHKVKEKSVYVLQLDSARIVLISAAAIGLIIASFLLGMNFIKGDKNGLSLSHSDPLDGQKELDFLKNNIPSQPDNDDMKPADEKFEPMAAVEPKEAQKDGNLPGVDPKKSDASERIAGDAINEAPTGIKEEPSKKIASEKPKKLRKKSRLSNLAKSGEHEGKKAAPAKKRRKSSVVEVSAKSTEIDPVDRQSMNYAVQVAAFDRKSQARAEVDELKNMNYDAHIDSTLVDGKRFYQVKIGPFSAKKRALSLLNELQKEPRYENSFLTRE